MATLEENLARRALDRLRAVVPPMEDRAQRLRSEVLMYDNPLWTEFSEGLQAELVETLWLLVDAEDYAETRALQRTAQRLRERLSRPEKAREEYREALADIEQERASLRAAAGLRNTGEGAAAPNGR